MMDLDLGMNNWMSDGVPVSRQADRPRQAADAGDAEAARRVGPLQGRGRRRHPVPHDSGRRHAGVLHARLGPQREGRSTASGPTTTSTTWTGWRASSRRRARTCRAGRRDASPGAKIGIIGYGTSHWAIAESRDQLREETDVETSYFRLRAYPFTDELGDVHRRARARLRRRAEPRRADAAADEARAHARARRRSCAACCTTTACRSTPAASPTTCWRRKASKSRRRRSHVAGVGGGMTGGE